MVCAAELSPHFVGCQGPCSLGRGRPGDTEPRPLRATHSLESGRTARTSGSEWSLGPSGPHRLRSHKDRASVLASPTPPRGDLLWGRPAASPAGPSDTQFPDL